MADNLAEFLFSFRTHGYRVKFFERLPPDFPLEHQIAAQALRLKTRDPNRPLRRIKRSVRDTIVNSQLEI